MERRSSNSRKVTEGLREYPLILGYIPKTEGVGQTVSTPAFTGDSLIQVSARNSASLA